MTSRSRPARIRSWCGSRTRSSRDLLTAGRPHRDGLPGALLPAAGGREDGLLRLSTTTSHCPFKGDAGYWSVETGDGVAEDVVWSYPEPFPRVEEIAGLLAFWTEKPGVTLEVNGQPA